MPDRSFSFCKTNETPGTPWRPDFQSSMISCYPVMVWQTAPQRLRDVNGDFTKHGQPVPRPDPTWGVGIAHFQLWGWRYPTCAQTVPFYSAWKYFPNTWSNQLNQSERLIYAPLAWITTDSGNGFVSSMCQAIAWTNFDLWWTAPLGANCRDVLVVWKKVFGNDMQVVVILSRPQGVKSFISSRTLSSRVFKPVAYTETICVPDLSIDLVA